MPSPGSLNRSRDADAAANEAVKGVAVGAARWSFPMLLISGAGQYLSPIYRGLTIQFKVFIVIGGMVFGGWVEGDRRLRMFEEKQRVQRKLARDEMVWREYAREAAEVARERREQAEREEAKQRRGNG